MIAVFEFQSQLNRFLLPLRSTYFHNSGEVAVIHVPTPYFFNILLYHVFTYRLSGGIGTFHLTGTYRAPLLGCPGCDELRGRSVPKDRSDHRRTRRNDPNPLRRHRAPTGPSWLRSLDIQTLGKAVESRLEIPWIYRDIEGCMITLYWLNGSSLPFFEMTFFSSARLASLPLMGHVA